MMVHAKRMHTINLCQVAIHVHTSDRVPTSRLSDNTNRYCAVCWTALPRR
jgi:hypothetical protein